MLYNSLSYGVFFAVVALGVWALPTHRSRLGFLLLASWLFYTAWYPIYLLLFLASVALNFAAGLAIAAARVERPAAARRLLVATVALNLANLGFFKYYNFFVQSGVQIARAFGARWSAPAADIFLPLGISFYTFQKIAYVVDVYRGVTPAIRNPLKMSLFAAFFPQLIAGPIVRSNEFIPQLAAKRRFDAQRLLHGLDLIAVGMFKKVLIADQLALFVDRVFAAPRGLGSGTLLLAAYAYSVQIYCDFSGYTDIGRGSAYCLGYELPRNFRFPYLSLNLTEFWRRWHMTLSQWLRDYLYIPLGGNRRGAARTYWNLMVTMALGGLWHGASWNFVIWGILHGAGLALTRLVHERSGVAPSRPLFAGRAYRVLSTAATFHFVTFAWIFFRAGGLSPALTVISGIASASWIGPTDIGAFGRVQLALVAVALLALGVLQPLASAAGRAQLQRSRAWAAARPLFYFAVTVGILLLAGRGPQQFIYFQF